MTAATSPRAPHISHFRAGAAWSRKWIRPRSQAGGGAGGGAVGKSNCRLLSASSRAWADVAPLPSLSAAMTASPPRTSARDSTAAAVVKRLWPLLFQRGENVGGRLNVKKSLD